ncbi:hypothetical protein [Bizionia myxarmorum]|uniref:Collagen-like protein n=1 Tax=Bizionia myxarmorum TaxID=291186 RepID=A0A5D0RCJ1_9FLAO|nr:hypothetical protein [Bizionia myxarmorum]TYB79390.1 hypothetical protein ES674_06350 [Bizionia myxarmorum]
MALLVVFSFSCSTEDGEDGPIGPAGTNGTNGTNGQDGNANVQTFIYDFSAKSGSSVSQAIPELTTDVLTNDVVLTYISASDVYYQVPNIMNPSGTTIFVRNFSETGNMNFRFSLASDNTSYSLPEGTIDELKVIIIESSSITTTGRTISGKQQIYNELNQAGVDINDYHAVCDYYGIAY